MTRFSKLTANRLRQLLQALSVVGVTTILFGGLYLGILLLE